MKSFMGIFVMLSSVTYCSADICQYNLTLSDLPGKLATNLIASIYHGIIKVGDCKDTKIDESLIDLWYWIGKSTNAPILLDKHNPKQLDPTKPIIILIHGWTCSLSNGGFPELTNAYLERYDYNIIGVDWSPYSIEDYGTAYCKVPLIADHVGQFICNNNLDTDKIHVVGHSLGAQMAGLIGQVVQQCNKKLNRITGLDPAGPVYQTNPPSKRLDAEDAKSVDVIHTNAGLLGYFGSCGTTDFFPNCGTLQPGCLDLTVLSLSDLLNIPTRDFNCNHFRSVFYMAESVQSDKFVGKSSILQPALCIEDVFYSTAVMGENCPPNTPSNKYILKTNSQPPYALG